MATETHTGRLIFGDGQVAVEDGTVLAVPHTPNPCAKAVARYAKWGQTQPVTVTGNTGIVDNSPVLFVTTIQWAVQAADLAVMSDDSPAKPKAAKTKKAKKKAASAKAARSRSKK